MTKETTSDRKSPFSLEGRTGRLSFISHFILFGLIFSLLSIPLGLISEYSIIFNLGIITKLSLFSESYVIRIIIRFLIESFVFIIFLRAAQAAAVRRCNDIRCSPKWLWIPILGLLIVLFIPGEKGPNKHGEPPK